MQVCPLGGKYPLVLGCKVLLYGTILLEKRPFKRSHLQVVYEAAHHRKECSRRICGNRQLGRFAAHERSEVGFRFMGWEAPVRQAESPSRTAPPQHVREHSASGSVVKCTFLGSLERLSKLCHLAAKS